MSSLDSEIQKHVIFDRVVREYINECLDNDVEPEKIRDSFIEYIKTEAVRRLKN